MSIYGDGLLKNEFERYSLENNLYRRRNEKLLRKISYKLGNSHDNKIIHKITEKQIEENLKKNKGRLEEAVKKLKKDNRELRKFNEKFEYTLEEASIGRSSRSNLGRGKKSKKKKSRKKKSRKKRGGRRRKTRRKTKRRRRK